MEAVEQHGGDSEGDQGEHNQGRGAENTDKQDMVNIDSVFLRNNYLRAERKLKESLERA